jgi:hypothetical protein
LRSEMDRSGNASTVLLLNITIVLIRVATNPALEISWVLIPGTPEHYPNKDSIPLITPLIKGYTEGISIERIVECVI